MIVQYTSESPPKFDGVVMIDCWQPQDNEIDKLIFFYRLSEYIGNNKDQYRQIVNASMQCRLDYEDPTIQNTLKSYSWNHMFDTSVSSNSKYQNSSVLLNTVEQLSGTYTLFQGLKQQLKGQNNCHYIVDLDDFLKNWSRSGSTRAKQWLVVGQSWQNCVHNNNIGLVSFSKILDYYRMEFYVMEEFVLNDNDVNPTEADFGNDTLRWMKYHGTTTYKLMPEQINIGS
jgi:hypothetical protein